MSARAPDDRLRVLEVFGLVPFASGVREAWRTIRGNPYLPPVMWDATSLRIFKPWISLPTWARRKPRDGRVPIYNFFNRVPQPAGEGYSVRVTYGRDYRGGRYTYDGHLGTDFAVPVGTNVLAPAPGQVVRVRNDLEHGGLKVCIDHGRGLFTTCNHLARATVAEGQRVERGDRIGRSGASGMEFLLFFPWVAPHVHFNVWLNGEPVDPFAREGEVSLWRRRNDPVPFTAEAPADDEAFAPTVWDADGVREAIDACRDPRLRAMMASIPDLTRRAAEVLVRRNYQSALFDAFPSLYGTPGEREPRLDLPFSATDFVGVRLPSSTA